MCTQYYIEYGCGCGINSEFAQCTNRNGTNVKCENSEIQREKQKSSPSPCRAHLVGPNAAAKMHTLNSNNWWKMTIWRSLAGLVHFMKLEPSKFFFVLVWFWNCSILWKLVFPSGIVNISSVHDMKWCRNGETTGINTGETVSVGSWVEQTWRALVSAV